MSKYVDMPRDEQVDVAKRLIMALVSRGETNAGIKAKISKTFGVDESFVRELMADIGRKFRQDMQDDDTVDFHIMAVVDRLARRAEANMANQTGNKADEALLKTYEYMRRRDFEDARRMADLELSQAKKQLIDKNAESIEHQGDILLTRPNLLEIGDGVEDAEILPD